jgi:SAM-dependent methyltransferase
MLATRGNVPEPPNSPRITRWNDRYARGENLHGFDPSPPLATAIAGVAPGTALDLACGAGRHAIFLAEHGWRVVAVDGSSVGIDRMLAEAQRRGCRERIEAHLCDLESEPPGFVIEPESYDLVADFFFLVRPLFPALRAGLRPGGLFVAAIHVESTGAAAAQHFQVERGELERMAVGWGWRVLHCRERTAAESGHEWNTAEIVAQRTE